MNRSDGTVTEPIAARDTELFVLSGNDRAHLLQQIGDLNKTVAQDGSSFRLTDLAWSVNRTLAPGGCRLAIVAGSCDELRNRLDRARQRLTDSDCRQIHDVTGLYFFAEPLYDAGNLAFLFPGEGSQYLGMLTGLADHFPVVRSIIETCERDSNEYSADQRPLSRFTVDPERWTAAEADELQRDLRRIDNAMFSVYMSNWAMLAVLQQMEIAPAVVAGHSSGELAALVMAGVFDPYDNLMMVRESLPALVGRDDSASALLAVGASRDVLEDVIAAALKSEPAQRASVAMDNCPHQAIAVGDIDAIAKVQAEALRRGLLCDQVALGRPYHTALFAPYAEPLRRAFADLSFCQPAIPVYSCMTGTRFPDAPSEIRRLTLAQWCAPVEFVRLIRNLYHDGLRIFVEVGPKNHLTSFVDDTLRGQPHLAVPSTVPNRSGLTQLHHLAAQLAAHHVPMRLDCFYENMTGKRVVWQPPGVLETNGRGSASRREVAPIAGSRSAAHSPPNADAVVRQHLALAEQFLDVQSQVMEQFLQRRNAPQRIRHRGRLSPSARRRSPPPAKHPPATPMSPREHPMIQGHRELVPGEKLIMRRTLDVANEHYAAHHTVGGRSISKVDPRQHGLPIMPMTFTLEMMMGAGATLFPQLTVLGVKGLRLSRWLAFYEEDPSDIELTATLLPAAADDELREVTTQVLVEVKDLGPATEDNSRGSVAAVGTVLLGHSYPARSTRGEFPLSNERTCRTNVATTYNNLFHGELFQGFECVERFGDEGIEGRVRALPRDELFASTAAPRFVGDPVLLDVATHPAVAWHLEQEDQTGRLMLPFELDRLELYGPLPNEGAQFCARTEIVSGNEWQYTQTTELFDDDDRLWGRLRCLKLWRFYLPFHDVNFHGPKDIYFLSDEWPEAVPDLPGDIAVDQPPRCCCVRLKALNDLKHAAIQIAAGRVMLSPAELDLFLALERPEEKKADWLFGRAAAKDAVRILVRKRDGERPFMADVEIFNDKQGRPLASPRGAQRPHGYPQVSIAHTTGHIAALASVTPYAGIDIEVVELREAGFVDVAFDDRERELLAAIDDRDEWITRFWCAKEAVGKALGRGLDGNPRSLAVRGYDFESGAVEVVLGTKLAEEFAELKDSLLAVSTRRDEELIVATTICQPIGASHTC